MILNHLCYPQEHWLAARPAGGHGRGVHLVLPGGVLPLGVALPPSAARHPAPQEPEEEGQGKEGAHQRREASLFRLHTAAHADSADSAHILGDSLSRTLHANLLSGKISWHLLL